LAAAEQQLDEAWEESQYQLKTATILKLQAQVARLESRANQLEQQVERLEVGYMTSTDRQFQLEKALAREILAKEFWMHEMVDAGMVLSTLEKTLREKGDRDEWLRRQLDGLIESAEAVEIATGLALARAVVGDLKDARRALSAAGEDAKPCDETEDCPSETWHYWRCPKYEGAAAGEDAR